jgi:hypothetical protein
MARGEANQLAHPLKAKRHLNLGLHKGRPVVSTLPIGASQRTTFGFSIPTAATLLPLKLLVCSFLQE